MAKGHVPVLAWWRRLERRPGGRAALSRVLGWAAPYTGTIGARVLELEPGRAVTRLRDRRRVRNHLGSVHAIALTNLAEFTASLALLAGLPDGARMIITRVEIDFVKKARGVITAEGTSEVPPDASERDVQPTAVLRDGAGDIVARAVLHARVGPVR